MRSLHLLVPALFWPDPAALHAYDGVDLPATARLLGRGSVVGEWRDGPTYWLARQFGVGPANQVPLAAIARFGSGAARDDRVWMRADPVHLHPQGSELFLTRGADLAIDPGEAAAMIAALDAFFAADGLQFVADDAHAWYIALERIPAMDTVPLELAHGHSIDPLLPRGDDALVWLKRLNEAQMLLHGLPVNEAREHRGLAAINSLWLWGAGTLPATASRWVDVIRTDDPLLRGLGRLSGARVAATTDGFAALQAAEGSTLVCIEGPTAPAASGDRSAWQMALERCDELWLRPALDALRAGDLGRIELTGFGARYGRTFRITRSDLWKLWRRPAPLASRRPLP
ncbi:MAG: hypothetical protein K2Y35_03320 [Burkholderiales bacterium]|nr:hypothetical protein [Burkholderiales bacterium]